MIELMPLCTMELKHARTLAVGTGAAGDRSVGGFVSARLGLSDPRNGITVYVAPLFETGEERYAWLDRNQAAGRGKPSFGAEGATLVHDYYEVR